MFNMMHLLAQIDPDLLMFQESFRGESWQGLPGNPALWGGGIMIAGLLLVAMMSWSMIQRDRVNFGPTNRRLYAAFGLNAQQRKLLKKLATSAGLTMPGCLLISRGSYERAVKNFIGRYGAAPLLAEIRLKAFGRMST